MKFCRHLAAFLGPTSDRQISLVNRVC